MTLEDAVRDVVSRTVVQYRLAGYPERPIDEIVDEQLNEMTKVQLLTAISDAFYYGWRPE